MVKRACLPFVNWGLRLKNVLFYGVWVLMKEWWELNLDTFIYIIPQLSRGVFFIAISLLVVPFQSFYALLPFFMIFGPLYVCLGSKKAFTAYLFFLGAWRMLESGPRYLISDCLKRRLRTTVLGTTSFSFGRGDKRPSPLFQYDILLFNSNKIKCYPSSDWDVSHDRLFRELSSFTSNLICRVPRVSSYAGYP